MNANQNLFENPNQAQQYVEGIREHYREEHATYSGRRNSDHLQLIVEVTSDEGRTIVDGVMLGILALGGADNVEAEKQMDEKANEPLVGERTWDDFRGAYSDLLVGFGIITHRLRNQKGFNEVVSYSELHEPDRMKAASVLFSDFLRLNALRFGVDTAGVPKTERKKVHPEDGGTPHYEITTTDKDKAYTEPQLIRNMNERGYRDKGSQHTAAKISPEDYVKLRREFSEKDKDQFDHDTSFHTNVREVYETQE